MMPAVTFKGYETAVIDPNGQAKCSTTDSRGRLTQVEELNDGPYTPNNIWQGSVYATNYAYDELENLTQVTDADGNLTQITYNTLGRKTRMVDPDMGTWYYHYDALSNLTAQLSAHNTPTDFYYDNLNRMIGKVYNDTPTSSPTTYGRPASPSGGYDVTYGYDHHSATPQNGHGAGIGRRTVMHDESGSSRWHYDQRGRVVQANRTFDDPYTYLRSPHDPEENTPGWSEPYRAYRTYYTYNQADWVTQTDYPDGETVTTGYTNRGLPKSLSGTQAGTLVQGNDTSYDKFARLTQTKFGNQTQTIYQYYGFGAGSNERNRLELITVKPPSPATDNLLHLYYRNYDAVGNIQKVTDFINDETLYYTYDHLDRLTQYNQGDSNQPLQTLVTYGYDLKQITWQADGLYTSSFIYDGDHNRLLKLEQTPTTEYSTVYIGGLYEQRFETTTLNLTNLVAYGASLLDAPIPFRQGRVGLASPLARPEREPIAHPARVAMQTTPQLTVSHTTSLTLANHTAGDLIQYDLLLINGPTPVTAPLELTFQLPDHSRCVETKNQPAWWHHTALCQQDNQASFIMISGVLTPYAQVSLAALAIPHTTLLTSPASAVTLTGPALAEPIHSQQTITTLITSLPHLTNPVNRATPPHNRLARSQPHAATPIQLHQTAHSWFNSGHPLISVDIHVTNGPAISTPITSTSYIPNHTVCYSTSNVKNRKPTWWQNTALCE